LYWTSNKYYIGRFTPQKPTVTITKSQSTVWHVKNIFIIFLNPWTEKW